jgi:hypothetical protein
MKLPEIGIVLKSVLVLLALAMASTSTMATTAKANYEQRARDWRNGAIVYQVLVDRFVPSANLDAKRGLYPAPKVLRDWSEPAKAGVYLADQKLNSAELGRDIVFKHAPDKIGGLIRPKEQDRMMYGAGFAMEAQAAVSTALQLRERARHLAELTDFQLQVEKLKRKKKALNAQIAKDADIEKLRIKALKLANKGKYTSKPHAAQYIAPKLRYKNKRKVAESTVVTWLRVKKWQKNSR